MFGAKVAPAEQPLTVAHELAEAMQATGLSNWGQDQTFRTGLAVLIEAIEEMNPPVALRTTAKSRIQHLLRQRLHIVEDETRHPEILEGRIERPVVVTGLPRSGTTVTYDLLALDPSTRTPREWELYCPWPAPEAATFDADPRIAQLNAIYQHILDVAPDFATVQRLDASQPGECNHQMMLHFSGSNFAAEMPVEKHRQWMCTQPAEGMYRSHKRVLQQLQWKGPRGRWTIKSPHHIFDLPGLLSVYPDACIVWTHRDPVLTCSSLSSMVAMLTKAFGAPVDLKQIGAQVTDIWTKGLLRGLQSRRDPKIAEHILDVAHRDVVSDAAGVVRRIHAFFDMPFTDEHARRVDAFVRESTNSKRLGKHKHDPAQFGIDPDKVRTDLAPYYERYGDFLTY